jgi:hypothetical protein
MTMPMTTLASASRSRPGTTTTTTTTTTRGGRMRASSRHSSRRGDRVVGRVAEGGKSERGRMKDEEEYAKFVEEARTWTAYDPEAVGGENATPPWEKELQDAMREGPWPCWDADIPESDFVDEPRFMSFTKPPEKYDPFKEKIVNYKAKVKEEQKRAVAKTREEVKSQRFMSMADDIRLKNKYEDDESAWDHEKIVELINFPDDIRHKMMSVSVEVYDPRFPYDFTGMGAPPLTTEEFLESIGRLQPDGESDLDRVAKLAEKYGSKVPELAEEDPAAILQTRSTFELQNAMDIGDEGGVEISKTEISDLVDSDDELP